MSYVSCTRKIMAFFFRYTRCLWGQCHIEEWVSWHWTMAVYAVYSMNLWRPSSRGILGKGNSPTKPTGSGRKFGFQTILFFGGGKVLAVHSQDIFHKKALVERILYCRSYDLPLWSLGTWSMMWVFDRFFVAAIQFNVFFNLLDLKVNCWSCFSAGARRNTRGISIDTL